MVDIALAALSVVVACRAARHKSAWQLISVYWCLVAVRNVISAHLPWWALLLLLGVGLVLLLLIACLRISAVADEAAEAMNEPHVIHVSTKQLLEYESEADILREAMEEEQW